MYQNILVPTDGSDISVKAVDTAIKLARTLGAKVHALSVRDPFPFGAVSEIQTISPQEYAEAQERIAQAHIAAVRQASEAAGIECLAQTVEAPHPWEAIVEHARRHGCDLIVMASHGRGSFSSLLLGSETQKVLSHTTVPLLIVR